MQSKIRLANHFIRQWIVALIYAFIFVICCHVNIFSRIDNMLQDAIYQHDKLLDGTIYVLGIDERALEELGPIQTWNRSIMADILNALNQNPEALPAVIGVDMMYYGETTLEDDKLLYEAAQKYNNVVTGSSVNFKKALIQKEDGSYIVDNFAVDSIEEPFPSLKKVTRQGHLNTVSDTDGVVRRSLHQIKMKEGKYLNSFAYEIYRMYAEKNGLSLEINPPMNQMKQWYIPFSSKPGGYNDNFSVVDILNGDIAPEVFENCIVLIGPYTTGMRDSYITSIDHSVPMYGVEVHANSVQALLNGKFYADLPLLLQCSLLFLVLIGAFWAFLKLSPRMGAFFLMGTLGLFFAGVYFLFQYGWLIRSLYLPIGLIILYGGWLAAHYATELLEKRRITGMFKKYVAPQVVDELMRKGKQNLQLGGAKKEIACMFVDIREFTPMSEVLSPEDVVEVLNDYLALTSSAIFAHEGTLDKFIGDATMALYNAPLDQEDYVYKAVLTAWDIVQGSKELNRCMNEKYGRSISFGIGINCGPAVVGNIGTDFRMDYTAIGDTINTASRLESYARPGQVLLSESVYNAVKDRIEAISLGEISLKGKAQGVAVYGLCQINEYKEKEQPLETAGQMPGKGPISYGNEIKEIEK